jgi:hypothetical protein
MINTSHPEVPTQCSPGLILRVRTPFEHRRVLLLATFPNHPLLPEAVVVASCSRARRPRRHVTVPGSIAILNFDFDIRAKQLSDFCDPLRILLHPLLSEMRDREGPVRA